MSLLIIGGYVSLFIGGYVSLLIIVEGMCHY